jgi:hypothetical protein
MNCELKAVAARSIVEAFYVRGSAREISLSNYARGVR